MNDQKQQDELDDPRTPKFATWRSFTNFSESVRRSRRYVWTEKTQAVLATAGTRQLQIPAGKVYYRAQKGVEYSEDGHSPTGYGSLRMKPLPDRASEGRANPAGIPVLYLASTVETAISETRPWVGAGVSVGTFRTIKHLKLVNFIQEKPTSAFRVIGLSAILEKVVPRQEKVLEAVWADIDNAFSRPVSREDASAADYAPTQILTELFADAGYDGIAYNSNFNGGHNLALFDVSSAEILSCAPYEVNAVHVDVKQIGNAWHG
ncbi:RES domain-containing protein [Sinorhizobium meliloti]|uniref:RES family NAD+ phosphorylase n=1 Tax=Rhizobium meliloti TaxID=382 RepID=UPI000FDCC69C|nr:RES family NAD+ phosphorylase [Sinorhizobium meliloti]RVG29909.1 RES domain-containing protein [Sinorhizobium meliloti]